MVEVLITGVRGKTGVALAASLAARGGVVVRGGSSTPARVTMDGVVPTAFSWDAPSDWAAALRGAQAVFLVRPDRVDAPELIGALLGKAAPGTRVVLLSEQAAARVGPDGWALRTEAAVRSSGLAWTVLQPSWFMQVLTDERFFRHQVLESGRLPFSSGGAAVAWIDARDIAAVAERALLDDRHAGEVHELTGPEALSLTRTAELISQPVGFPVTHDETSVEESAAGTEGFERTLTLLTYERVHAGHFTAVTDTVERVTGHPARTLQSFLTEHLGPRAS